MRASEGKKGAAEMTILTKPKDGTKPGRGGSAGARVWELGVGGRLRKEFRVSPASKFPIHRTPNPGQGRPKKKKSCPQPKLVDDHPSINGCLHPPVFHFCSRLRIHLRSAADNNKKRIRSKKKPTRCHGRRSAAAGPSRKHGVQWGVQHVPTVGPADDAASRRRERRCRRDEEAVKVLNTRVQGNCGLLARLGRCQGRDVGRESRKHLVVRHGRLRARGVRPRVDGCGWEGRDNGKDRHVVLRRHKVPLVLAALGVGLLRPPVVDRCCRPGHHHVLHVCFFLLRNGPKRASLDASTQS